mgnify:CR=1 FL=1
MAVTDYKGPAIDSSELKELKEKVVNGCLILDREGITDGFGHVSVRIPEQSALLTNTQSMVSRGRFQFPQRVTISRTTQAPSTSASVSRKAVPSLHKGVRNPSTITTWRMDGSVNCAAMNRQSTIDYTTWLRGVALRYDIIPVHIPPQVGHERAATRPKKLTAGANVVG